MTDARTREDNVQHQTMQAVMQDRYGGPEVLELRTVPVPDIDDDQVLIKVDAASLNPLDWHYMRATPFFMRLVAGLRRPDPAVRGVDVSGVVEAVGSAVTRLRRGDEVFGTARGSLAEYAAASPDRLTGKPEQLTHEAAAAMPVAAVTALQGLRDHGRLEAGQHVLVIGASGGVGTFAVQIARWMGAEVTGVCSTRNVEMVRRIGAHHVIDYTTTGIADVAERYDVVIQLAGTDSPLTLRRLLTEQGSLVLSSGTGRFSGIDRLAVGLATSPFVSQRIVSFVADETAADLALLAQLAADGDITSEIDRRYDLANAADAMAYVEAGHTQGKVVVVP